MGVWSTWVPIGSTAMLIAAPLLTQASRWQTVWWFGGAYALVATALALTLVKPGPGSAGSGTAAGGAVSPPAMSTAQVLRHRDLWLLSLAFGCFNMVVLAAATYLPTYLNLVRGLSLPHESWARPAALSPTGSARASGPTWPVLFFWPLPCRWSS